VTENVNAYLRGRKLSPIIFIYSDSTPLPDRGEVLRFYLIQKINNSLRSIGSHLLPNFIFSVQQKLRIEKNSKQTLFRKRLPVMGHCSSETVYLTKRVTSQIE